MKRTALLPIAAAAAASLLAVLACGASSDGVPTQDGGFEGRADVIAPPGCDPTKSPKESPACVSDDFGVFVSPLGKDGATGKKTDPLRSIAEAVGKGKPRVYVCEGTYDANVAITTPVAIYGGLTCLWEPSETARPKLAPPKGIALRVTKVAGAVEIADLDVVGSADANTPGDSAIAAFVSESDGVTFRRTNLTAGAGTAGTKGASRLNYAGATATKGANGSGGTAGGPTSCSCADGTMSTGGAGASGAGAGIQNGTANPAVGGANAGSTSASTCGGGLPGANGLAAGGGAPAASPGTLSAEGWNSSTSANAQNGNPAQGGGGGGAKTDVTSAGGGGGCGGCGGAGGARGTNGGSSFAVLSFNSGVTIESGSAPSGLTSGPGGRGGDGGDGQVGQGPGGAGTGPACNGGAGGSGAGGSGGGGGAGGHSVPVAFVGTEPKVTRATVTPGAKGAAGPGGAAGAGPDNAGAPGTPGPEGKAQTTLAL